MAKKKDILPQISETEVEHLVVEGARVHNLKNIDVSIPRNKLVVITGISGSGKSSLAFDTIYAEGQRRYLDSFSAYARQFIGNMERPDVDKITGLSPVVSIEQKSTSKNPRSTVGTVTEIYDFMRLLFARASDAYSYVTGKKMTKFSEDQILDSLHEKLANQKVVILTPLVKGRKGHYRELFEQIRKQGFLKVRIDGEIQDILPRMQVDRYKIHDIEVVVDRLKVNEDNKDRIRQSVQRALKMGDGLMMVMNYETNEIFNYSQKLMCPESGVSYDEPSPNTFSFNSPYGACQACKGLGVVHEVFYETIIPDNSKNIAEGGILPLGEQRDTYIFKQLKKMGKIYGFTLSTPIKDISKKGMEWVLYGDDGEEASKAMNYDGDDDKWYTLDSGVVGMIKRCFKSTTSDSIRKGMEDYMEVATCPSCNGYRLQKESLNFKVDAKHIGEIAALDINGATKWFENIEDRLNEKQNLIAKDILKEIRARLGFLEGVGLTYLTIDRQARSLSGGESQRIRLATQIGSQLTGVTYILDEPSIGLHQRDNQRLINALKELRDVGNSVLVVEHDKDIMLQSDYVIDIGPAAGKFGGEIVGEGAPDKFGKIKTITAGYLTDRQQIEVPKERRSHVKNKLVLKGLTGNNLKNVDVEFPLGIMICVTGVSGSGKSSMVNETLYPILSKHFYRSRKKPLPYKSLKGLEYLDKVIEIDQSPIGRTPRSNPATYIKVFDEIRRLFAQMPEAQIRGYQPGRFSFNVKGGRCEECGGGGMRVIEMNFLPDVLVECEKCLGKRYNRETLEIRYKGKSISDVLKMSVNEAVAFFENVPRILRKVKTLQDVGLGYLTLGQSSTTISGGEAQRVKLSSELSKKDTGSTFYILDEPTTGLHFEDIRMLLKVLNKLVEKGNTVLVIEHNLDVVKVADYIIDLGPEGGNGGGQIIAKGTPEEVAKVTGSHTAMFLKKEL